MTRDDELQTRDIAVPAAKAQAVTERPVLP